MIEIITDNALDKLNELSRHASVIKGAVAYWTFPTSQIDPAFVNGLAAPGSFLCCDIHSPTSIDVLDDFHRQSARIFVHLYQLVGRTEVADSKGIPDHLMHAKVFIFEDGSDQCSIWVGSHNGTARALLGVNFECTVVFRTLKTSRAYVDLDAHLQTIKSRSERFDSNDKEYYRMLQGMANADAFIEVVDQHEAQLKPGTELTIFGSHLDDHRQLKNVGKKVYLAVTSVMTGKETFYESSITQSGEFSGSAVTFDARRYAFRSARALPELEKKKAIPLNVYQQAKFFVTLKLGKPLVGVDAIEAPPLTLWEDISVDAYLSECSDSDRRLDRSDRRFPTAAKVKIQKARSRDEASDNDITRSEWARAFTVLALEDKRTMVEHPLVRRRIIKELKGNL